MTTAFLSPEAESYCRRIQSLLERISACLQGFNETQLNRRPPIPDVNSMYVIGAHVLGSAREWVLGFVCRQPVQRDRPAEFRSRGAHAGELINAAQRLGEEIEAALAGLAAPDLENRSKTLTSLRDDREPHEISVREALMEIVEHVSIHLGHLELTRDWVLQSANE